MHALMCSKSTKDADAGAASGSSAKRRAADASDAPTGQAADAKRQKHVERGDGATVDETPSSAFVDTSTASAAHDVDGMDTSNVDNEMQQMHITKERERVWQTRNSMIAVSPPC